MSAVHPVSLVPPRRTLAERYPALRRFLRHRPALLGLTIVLFMTLASFVGHECAPASATLQ